MVDESRNQGIPPRIAGGRRRQRTQPDANIDRFANQLVMEVNDSAKRIVVLAQREKVADSQGNLGRCRTARRNQNKSVARRSEKPIESANPRIADAGLDLRNSGLGAPNPRRERTLGESHV